MNGRYAGVVILIVVVVLTAGCGLVTPTATPIPPTATAILSTPMQTSVPSTAATVPPTVAPSLMPTDIPPTEVPIETATPLPTDTATPSSPLSGSGGGVIAFTSEIDGDSEIYVMNADGSDQRRLTNHPQEDYWPTWSPDGTYIAFASERDGNFEIYVMGADGSDQRRLTDDSADDLEPAWSPDGRQIALMVYSAGKSSIHVMDADGSNRRRLTGSSSSDSLPAWSPDGTQIAFVSDRDGNSEIYVMDADGSNQRRLTNNIGDDSYPAWSPAGAPGGEQISFSSVRDGRRELYLMDADGGNVRQLTHDDAPVWVSSWSPSGTQIAFESERDGSREIYVMAVAEETDASGTTQVSHLRRLTNNHVLDGIPAWQPSDRPSDRANTWIRAFEGSNYGAFFDIALTEDGNILAVGATNHLHVPPYSGDALLMKLTLEGDVLWERTWGGDGYEQAWSVALVEDGYYIFGETDSYGAGNRDFFLLKIAQDGSADWFRTYGRARREWPYGMLLLANGDLLIHGYTESLVGSGTNQYALRLGSDGEVIWDYIVESPDDEMVIDALETTENDLVLAVAVEEDGKLVKLDADGNVRWTHRYELAGWQFASEIAETDDGGILLTGFSMSAGSRRQADTWLARCTPAGELRWETSFGDSAYDDYATSLIRLKDGTYLIGGIGNGMLLSHIDQDGNILWRRSLVGQTVYGATGLIELEDGGYLVAGFIQITNGRSYDAILLRTDAEGWVGE